MRGEGGTGSWHGPPEPVLPAPIWINLAEEIKQEQDGSPTVPEDILAKADSTSAPAGTLKPTPPVTAPSHLWPAFLALSPE